MFLLNVHFFHYQLVNRLTDFCLEKSYININKKSHLTPDEPGAEACSSHVHAHVHVYLLSVTQF